MRSRRILPPEALEEAAEIYRHRFVPGLIDAPKFMLAANVFAADTDAEAHRLRTSTQQGFLNLSRGRAGQLPKPVDDFLSVATAREAAMVNHTLRITAVGARDTVRQELQAMISRYQPDEIILTSMIHDHGARLRSFEITADVLRDLKP